MRTIISYDILIVYIVLFCSQVEKTGDGGVGGRTVNAGSYSDDGCKILALGGNVVFAVSGMFGDVNPSVPTDYPWDAYALAGNEFHRTLEKRTSHLRFRLSL